MPLAVEKSIVHRDDLIVLSVCATMQWLVEVLSRSGWTKRGFVFWFLLLHKVLQTDRNVRKKRTKKNPQNENSKHMSFGRKKNTKGSHKENTDGSGKK
jgi:hypothetical protein